MKLPSLHNLLEKAFRTLIRFPFVMLAATAGSYFAIRAEVVSYDNSELRDLYTKGIMTAALALVLFLAVKLYGERKNFSVKIESLLHVLPVLLITLYYITLPQSINAHMIIQFALFNIGLHLLVSITPFLGGNEPNGFWQYNKALFLRFLTSALYSAVLFIGLALALLAIDKLFGVDINSKWYFRLWVVIACILNTWIFLAGVPHKFHELEAETDYPKGLKIFTQYILLPIITVYMLILYGYEGKILITSHWPVGWVSYLVLAFSIVGILSLLLIWPVRENADSTWIKGYSRFFYIALLPLITMLFIAIFKRVSVYGITENRYFIIVLAGWLTCISLYFIFSSHKNIRIIPLTLCIIAFLSSFGPWGAFSISEHSQYNRLYSLLDKNHMIKEGKVKVYAIPVSHDSSTTEKGYGNAPRPNDTIPYKDRKGISSTVEYLIDVHGLNSVQPLFAEKLKNEENDKHSWGRRYDNDTKDELLDKMGIKYINRYESEDEDAADSVQHKEYSSYSIPSSDYKDVRGYDELFDYDIYSYNVDKDSVSKEFKLKDGTVFVSYYAKTQELKLSSGHEEIFSENVKEIEDKVKAGHPNDNSNVDPAVMTVEKTTGNYKVKVLITSLRFSNYKGKNTMENLNATILLKKE